MRQTIKLLSSFFGWLYGLNAVHATLSLAVITATVILLAVDWATTRKPKERY